MFPGGKEIPGFGKEFSAGKGKSWGAQGISRIFLENPGSGGGFV
jgi:hypothetical protein